MRLRNTKRASSPNNTLFSFKLQASDARHDTVKTIIA
ncbi:uncharacterized protein METZ01_LOCUS433451, partial [marine metagenome]